MYVLVYYLYYKANTLDNLQGILLMREELRIKPGLCV
jgi:hypothetical protein